MGVSVPPTTSRIKINFNGKSIEQVDHTRFLGVLIDEKLERKNHVVHILSKISSGLYSLRCLKIIVQRRVRRNVYLSNVESHLNYALCTWGPMNSSKLHKNYKAKC